MGATDGSAESERGVESQAGPFQSIRRLLPWTRDEEMTEFGRLRKAMKPVTLRPIPAQGDMVGRQGLETDMELLSGRHNPQAASFLLSHRKLMYEPKYGLTYDVWTESPSEHVSSLPSQSLSLQKLAASFGSAIERMRTAPDGSSL